MSAEELGRRLVGEVRMCGLDEVLRTVRHLDGSASSRFGIPPLDRLLGLFEQQSAKPPPQRRDPESPSLAQALQTLQNLIVNPKPPIVEFTSIGVGAGKTHLLYLIVTMATLPRMHNGIDLGGKDRAVVVLDTDGRFLIDQLTEVMRNHIQGCIQRHVNHSNQDTARESHEQASTTSRPLFEDKIVTALMEMALIHVHILHPESHAALLKAIEELPVYLFHRTAHHSTHRAIHSIILDSASAFFWPLKAAEDNAKIPSSAGSSTNPATATTASVAYTALVRHLRHLQKTFDCAVIATTISYPPTKTSTNPGTSFAPAPSPVPSLRPLLPPSWTSFPTLRLALARDAVSPFALGMGVREALAERAERQRVVGKGVFSAWVDGWGADAWSARVREGVREAGRFGFVVRGEGVWVVDGVDEDGEGKSGE